jgi:hypothetical protein
MDGKLQNGHVAYLLIPHEWQIEMPIRKIAEL